MAKQKEIKFQDRHGDLRGRQNGMEFWIRKGEPQTKSGEKRYFVAIYPVSNNPRQISTLSRQDFDLAGAKEFCQKIAAGEINLEDLQAAYDAEDAAKEQAAILDVTERAKKFHARLDAMGLKYRDLLELEVLAHSLGDVGHNILLGYERGEGWPEAAGQTPTEREPETGENPYWAIYPLPEDCRSLFVFASAEQFDRCVKNGVIPLHDDRDSPGEMRIPCFIGYAVTQDLKCLDKLAGLSGAIQEQGKQPDHSETTGI